MNDYALQEQATLAAMLCFPDCISKVIASGIVAEDFYDENNRKIYEAILQHINNSSPLELPALTKTLGKNRRAIEIMASLIEIATTGETAPHYARQVIASANNRRIMAIGERLRRNPEDARELLSQLLDLTEPKILSGEQPLFTPASELLSKAIEVNYLIDKIIETATTGQIFGPSGSGKTFVALCLALAIATGQDWNGRKVKQGIALYLAGEGRTALIRRIKAWHTQKPSRLDLFHISSRTISIDGEGAAAVIREGKAIAERLGFDISIIVIDTLARHMPGDENSTKDMGAFIEAVDLVRAEFPGSTSLIIHHTGNNEETKNRSRGSSALKAAMDFELCCNKGLLTFTKMKDAEAPPPMEFKLVPIQIGTDDDGNPITSCVVEYGQRSAKNQAADLTVNERLLAGLVHLHSDPHELRMAFFDKRKEDDPEAKHNTLKNAFLRAYQGLQDKKVINIADNVVSFKKPTTSHVTDRHKSSQNDGEAMPSHVTHPLIGCDDVTHLVTNIDDYPLPHFPGEAYP